jgi:RHS repeat-associated protein
MKKIGIVILSLFSVYLASGQTEVITIPYFPDYIESFEGDNSIFLKIYDPALVTVPDGLTYDESLVDAVPLTDCRLDSVFHVLSLNTNTSALSYELSGKNYEAGLTYKLIYFNMSTNNLDSTDWLQLSIDYSDLGNTTYKTKDYHLLKNAGYVRLRIDSFYVRDRNTNTIVNDLLPYTNLFELRQTLTTYKTMQPVPAEAPQFVDLRQTNNGAYLNVDWLMVDWATSYDVEWTYIDDYPENPGDPPLNTTELNFDFKENSTRVNTKAQQYEIPLIFDRGYVVARVRAVGNWGTPLQRIEGVWSLPDVGSLDAVPLEFNGFQTTRVLFYIEESIVHEQAAMYWQHIAVFAEEGKRKDVVQYMDGSMRGRQTSTQVNTDENLVTVETIYDHQGRPAVQMLPTPHQPPALPYSSQPGNIAFTLSPVFRYAPDFNLNTSDEPYNRTNFDLGGFACVSGGLIADPLSTNNGAGQYYSPANPDQSYENAYIPDAKGYPFIHTEYTPDNTGRISRLGSAGVTHQLEGGHETKFFYSSPSQPELDRIFGLDAGFAEYYKKEVAIDPNGQINVAYKDGRGNVVATALAGEAPEMLEELPEVSSSAKTITIDLLRGLNRREAGSNSLVSRKTIFIAGEGDANVAVDVDYQLEESVFTPADCPGLCYDCAYDLSIKMMNSCGEIVLQRKEALDNPGFACSGMDYFLDTSLMIPPGEYTIIKNLTVNEDALEEAVADFLNQPCVTDSLPKYLAEEPVPPGCFEPCIPCTDTTLAFGTLNVNAKSGNTYTIDLEFNGIAQSSDPECSQFCPADAPNRLEGIYQMMLGDVSPGGQYGLYYDTNLARIHVDTFPLSVFNDENELPLVNANWRHPLGNYRDENGALSYVEIPLNAVGELDRTFFNPSASIQYINGRAHVAPEYIERVADFLENWQASWAQALLYYHPEYFYYDIAKGLNASYEIDQRLDSIETYADALASGDDRIISLTNDDYTDDFNDDDGLTYIDPLFLIYPEARTKYENIASKYIQEGDFFGLIPSVSFDYDILEVPVMAARCSNPGFKEAEVNICLSGKTIYDDSATQDVEWNTYKSIALSLKDRARCEIINEQRQDEGGFFSRIGSALFEGLDGRDDPYANKEKRFACNSDIENYHPDEEGDPSFNTHYDFFHYFQEMRFEECSICPVAYDLQGLINSLLVEDKLLQTVEIPRGTIGLSDEIVDFFDYEGDPYEWTPTLTNPYTLDIDILVEVGAFQEELAAELRLELDPSQKWTAVSKDLIFISCLTPKSSTEIFLTGYTSSYEEVPMLLSSSGFNFNTCSFPETCRSTEYTDDLLMLFRFLYENDSLAVTHLLYKESTGFSKPYFGTDFENYALGIPNIDEVYWQYLGFDIQAFCKQNARLVFHPTSGPDIFCDFSIDCSEITGITDDFTVLAIEREITQSDPPDYPTKFILVLEGTDGRKYRVPITQPSGCFPAFDCKLPATNEVDDLICCIPIGPLTPIENNCEDDHLEMAEDNAERRYERFKRNVEQEFRKNYTDHCLQTAESFLIDYSEKIYQYTLYYYDQAGNLIQTVPPKGIIQMEDVTLAAIYAARLSPTTDDDVFYNNHNMPSDYSYNSLNEVISQTSPDAGTTTYTYDEIGRLIVSQDAALAADEKIAYQCYDAIGRLTEGGVTNALPVSLPSRVDYDDFETAYLSGLKTEVFRHVYDEALPGTDAYFNFEDRILRNRIATVLYQDTFNLSSYDHAFHYQYDIQGNKKELAIDYAKLENLYSSESACLTEDIVFDNTTVEDGIYQTNSNISTMNTVEVLGGSDVTFQAAGEITLQPGFTAGPDFTALIAPCSDTASGVPVAQHLKKVEYDYDLFSGKVNRMTYQRGQEDQLIHFYEYDADNRLINVSTSTFAYEPALLRDQDAAYYYYKHGPMSRMEIGAEQVHGRDYAYTIQGWLRGVNSASLEPYRDIGKDATMGFNDLFAQDAYGFELGYFEDDYEAIGVSFDLFYTETGSTVLNDPASNYKSLYDGSIRYAVNANMGFESEQMQLHAYRYDQLYRLNRSQLLQDYSSMLNTWNDPDMSSRAFESNYLYDANGNISAVQRYNGNADLLDDLTYQYDQPLQNNRLQRVEDAVTTSYSRDLENQSGDNYAYDAKGRLLQDVAENITELNWYANDRLKEVEQNGLITSFEYDALGRRVLKETPEKTTYTVRTDAGQILAVYDIQNDSTTWKYAPIYGTSRLGILRPDKLMDGLSETDTVSQFRGKKQYELTNHLGNINTLISDRKVPDDISGTFLADLINATDVYPFGMPMPERQFSNQSYAFGFQGMEKDDDLKGEGNSYNTEFRQYDPRVGRWLSVDQVIKAHESAYAGFGNNPISFIDPLGLDNIEVTQEQFEQLRSEIKEELMDVLRVNFEDEGDLIREVESRIDYEIEIRFGQVTITDSPVAVSSGGSRNTSDEGPLVSEPLPELGRNSGESGAFEELSGGVGNLSDGFAYMETVEGALSVAGEGLEESLTPNLRSGATSLIEAGEITGRLGRVGRFIPVVSAIAGASSNALTLAENGVLYSNGDISTGEYVKRAAVNITAGTVGSLLPFGDNAINYYFGGNPDGQSFLDDMRYLNILYENKVREQSLRMVNWLIEEGYIGSDE